MKIEDALDEFYKNNSQAQYISPELRVLQDAQFRNWISTVKMEPFELNVGSWVNHHLYMLIFMLACIVYALFGFAWSGEETVKFWNISIRLAIGLFMICFFILSFKGAKFNVEAVLSREPTALAIFCGLVCVGLCVIVAGGGG